MVLSLPILSTLLPLCYTTIPILKNFHRVYLCMQVCSNHVFTFPINARARVHIKWVCPHTNTCHWSTIPSILLLLWADDSKSITVLATFSRAFWKVSSRRDTATDQLESKTIGTVFSPTYNPVGKKRAYSKLGDPLAVSWLLIQMVMHDSILFITIPK